MPLEKIIYSAELIQMAVKELAEKINTDFSNSDLHIVALLKSGLFFASDLIKLINCPVSIDFLELSDYGDNGRMSETIKIKRDLSLDVEHKNVLLVDTLAETGLTLDFACSYLTKKKPSRINICVLLDNPSLRLADINISYSCFTCSYTNIVGYGLDLDGSYRSAPYICSPVGSMLLQSK